MIVDAPAYPAGLRLGGRLVVVVGGGHVAQRRVAGLLAAAADVVLISPAVTASLEDLATTGRLRWEDRVYADGDLDGAWYALALTDSAEVNAAVVAEAERRRIFCVRADDATDASAWTPATGRHEGVTVAVLAGRDPRRAVAVRDAVLEGLRDGSIGAPHHRDKLPGVCLVGGGPGDPGLITVRGRQALHDADVVVTDRLVPRALLDELPPHVEVIDAAKIPYGRSMAQDAINRAMVERALAGKYVVRLKGGDPFVFGRGFEEALACAEAGVPVEIVPGVTSAVSVPAVAGIPVTHRGVAHEFVVVSAHVAPGDPASLVDWPALARLRGTLVLLMGVDRLPAVVDVLLKEGRPRDTPAAVIQDGTTADQRQVRATLGTIVEAAAEAGLRHPAITVIGDVVGVGDQLTALRARPGR